MLSKKCAAQATLRTSSVRQSAEKKGLVTWLTQISTAVQPRCSNLLGPTELSQSPPSCVSHAAGVHAYIFKHTLMSAALDDYT